MAETRGKPREFKLVLFGYGIIDAKGNPYWDEGCVCEDRNVLGGEVVAALNADLPRPQYRTVALYRKVAR